MNMAMGCCCVWGGGLGPLPVCFAGWQLPGWHSCSLADRPPTCNERSYSVVRSTSTDRRLCDATGVWRISQNV